MVDFQRLMVSLQKTAYFKWAKAEGIPMVEGYALKDVRDLKLAPWKRTGGNGSFIHLYGQEGVTGMYVAEIPPGGALAPEKHIYEELICILDGHGASEVWQEGAEKKKHLFEWGPLSVFANPLNTWHRLVNGGREPVKFLAVTNAPLILDHYRLPEFVFNCPFVFSDRYAGEEGYFNVTNKIYESGMSHVWETNFVPDVGTAKLDAQENKGADVKITQFQIGGNSLIGHISHWPMGRYHKAHFHGAGAILLGLQSEGYVLLWPNELGHRPYTSGHGDEVIEVEWQAGSVYCPPANWYHQHFNTGAGPARHLALRYGGRVFPTGFFLSTKRFDDGVLTSIKKGGTLLEYEDEDPEVRRHFEAVLAKKGIKSDMPPVKISA
ncbi:MAG: cupin domain-containing protein [Deltaproteobacteria bacterium]|nr:cupin domain-containing protein [Deltaproteobacteria bacterium]